MSHHSDSDDTDAPESFSFTTTKKSAAGADQALQRFHAAEKLTLKERRRERDRVLKERKAEVKAKKASSQKQRKGRASQAEDEDDGEEPDSGRTELEERMERAMREAAEESGEASDSKEDDGFEGLGDDMHSSASGSVDEEDGDVAMGSASSDEEERDDHLAKRPTPSSKPSYLPDHLFSAAFAQSQSSLSKTKGKGKAKLLAKSSDPVNSAQKRKRAKRSAKDIVIGARTIRTLPKSTDRSSTSSLPMSFSTSTKTDRFLNKSLNLRGDTANAKLRGWERRPANVGVMKRLGPAAHFVRS